MAYRKYGRKAYNTGRRYAHNYRRNAGNYARSVNKGNAFKLRLGNEYMLGAALGFTNMDEKIPADVKLMGATMPVGGKIGGKAKALSQGMVFGNVVQHMLGVRLPESAGGKDDTL